MPHRRFAVPLAALRPAVETWSMVFIMLGASFIAVTVMVVWISTPETLSLSPFGPHAAIVRGGQAFAEIAPAVRKELQSALLLLVGGLIGLLSSRGRSDSAPVEVERSRGLEV